MTGGERAIARLVLVGFMGAGKSSVGRLLGDRLGWRHIDLDEEIEREAECAIHEIFAREGEDGFRRREREATRRIAHLPRVVLTPGGGWFAQPGLPALLGRDTLSVWLQVSPERVVHRLSDDPGLRPLLSGSDPLPSVRRLLEDRVASYRQADLKIDTDRRTPEEVSAWIEGRVRPHLISDSS